jgi:hypothetical protein
MPHYLYGRREQVDCLKNDSVSGYFATIQPVGNLVRIITPVTTYPIGWDTTGATPVSQCHWMQVDQVA